MSLQFSDKPKRKTKIDKRLEVQKIFPNASIWGLNENGSIDFSLYKNELGRIRLFCCTHLFSGKIEVLQKLQNCAYILGANEYSIHPSADGNDWVELYYNMTPQEMKDAEIKELKDKLNKLETSKI